MSSIDQLLEHHIRYHPDEVKGLLAAHEPEEIGGLVTSLDPADALRLVLRLDMTLRRTLFGSLDDECLMAILLEASGEEIYPLISVIDPDRIERLIGSAKTMAQQRLKSLLGQRTNTVSARMNSDYLTFSPNSRVEDVLSTIADSYGSGVRPIYIVDSDDIFLGEVDLFVLTQNRGSSKPVSTVLQNSPTLHADQLVQSVMQADLWEGRRYLPVVDQRERLVGCMSVFDVSESLGSSASTAQLWSVVLSEYIKLLGELAATILSVRKR